MALPVKRTGVAFHYGSQGKPLVEHRLERSGKDAPVVSLLADWIHGSFDSLTSLAVSLHMAIDSINGSPRHWVRLFELLPSIETLSIDFAFNRMDQCSVWEGVPCISTDEGLVLPHLDTLELKHVPFLEFDADDIERLLKGRDAKGAPRLNTLKMSVLYFGKAYGHFITSDWKMPRSRL
jgi:hypothetical protein